jgi:hypothetical protein
LVVVLGRLVVVVVGHLVVVVGRLVVVVVLRVVVVGFSVVVVVVVVVVVNFGRLLGRTGRSTTIDSATTPSKGMGSSSQINSSCGEIAAGVTRLLLYFLGTCLRRDRPEVDVAVPDLMGAAVVLATAEALLREGGATGVATGGVATGMPAVTCRISDGADWRQLGQSSSTNL